MGRKYKNIVPLDGYPRIGPDGAVTHPLEGCEFVVPSKGPLHTRVAGQSACVSLVRKNTAEKLMATPGVFLLLFALAL
jgi:hypothetical protein